PDPSDLYTCPTRRTPDLDDAIVERAAAGDLVVTQDIPLASRVLAMGAQAVNPRGEPFTPDNIAERLSVRNFMEELRGAGVQTGGDRKSTRLNSSHVKISY